MQGGSHHPPPLGSLLPPTLLGASVGNGISTIENGEKETIYILVAPCSRSVRGAVVGWIEMEAGGVGCPRGSNARPACEMLVQ